MDWVPRPIAQLPCLLHHADMSTFDKRQYPRRPVNLAAVVLHSVPAPTSVVIDLSEGGVGLEWNLPDDIEVGAMIRLRFLLVGDQSVEIEACIVRIANGRAGLEFLSSQEILVRQLLAEVRSAEDD